MTAAEDLAAWAADATLPAWEVRTTEQTLRRYVLRAPDEDAAVTRLVDAIAEGGHPVAAWVGNTGEEPAGVRLAPLAGSPAPDGCWR